MNIDYENTLLVRGNTMKNITTNFRKWIGGNRANDREISFFEVKDLYEAAYAEKAKARPHLKRFKELLAKATAADAIYRAQLAAQDALKYGRAA